MVAVIVAVVLSHPGFPAPSEYQKAPIMLLTVIAAIVDITTSVFMIIDFICMMIRMTIAIGHGMFFKPHVEMATIS